MFKSDLVVKKRAGESWAFKTVEPLIWEDGRFFIAVPPGFTCDFASVPVAFQWIFPKMGTLTDRPAVLHDYIYAAELFERADCDRIFYNAMLHVGVSKWKAWAMYQAVRIGGGMVWNKHKKTCVNQYRELGGYRPK